MNEANQDNSEKINGVVALLIKLRKEARENKDWALSDQIRDELIALGIQLKDGREGTHFQYNNLKKRTHISIYFVGSFLSNSHLTFYAIYL